MRAGCPSVMPSSGRARRKVGYLLEILAIFVRRSAHEHAPGRGRGRVRAVLVAELRNVLEDRVAGCLLLLLGQLAHRLGERSREANERVPEIVGVRVVEVERNLLELRLAEAGAGDELTDAVSVP